MAEPDYAGYVKSLEAIRDGLIKDYWVGLVDINRHQVNVARTYLWVAVALIGAYVAAIDRYHSLILSQVCVLVVCSFSFSMAAVAFGVCLLAIPVRKGYRAIPSQGWGEFSGEAYNLLQGGSPNVQATFLANHIAKIDHAYAHNFRTNKSRAFLLRATSWLLVSSFFFAVLSGVAVSVSAAFNQEQEKVMPNEENPSSEPVPASTPSQSQLNIPAPPPPADIGGPNISTNSQHPTTGRIFITDSIKSKE